MFKIGLSTATKITEELFASSKKAGIECMEVSRGKEETDAYDYDKIKEWSEKYGIELVCAATGNDFTEGSSKDAEKIKGVIDMCSELGVKYLRVFAGFSPVADVVGERWDVMIEALSEIADYSKDKGVTIAIETHGGVNGYDDGVEHFYSTSTEPAALKSQLL